METQLFISIHERSLTVRRVVRRGKIAYIMNKLLVSLSTEKNRSKNRNDKSLKIFNQRPRTKF